MLTAAQPRSALHLFQVFTRLALQGFGGVLAVAQRELVEQQGWLSREEFLAVLSTSQVLPGPNIVNLALIVGDRYFGWRGAAAALAGLLLVPGAIVIALAVLYGRFSHWPAVAGALRGMGAVAAGLIMSTAIKLAAPLRHNVMGLAVCGLIASLAAIAVGALRWPMPLVVLGLGGASVVYAWRRLAPVGNTRP